MASRAAKLLTGFFIVAVLLVVATLVITRNQPPPVGPPLPKPNGYDDLVQAGRMVADNTSDFSTISEADLRALVTKNSEAVKLARTGLTRQCQVPLDMSAPNPTYFTNLAVLKRLAQAMTAEGRLAELDNRPVEAAESYLGVIRLGYAISQGGLLIDSLVGIAVEAIGTVNMEKLTPRLDAKQCREASTVLESCQGQREPMQAIVAREHAWGRRAYGLKGQLARLVNYRSMKMSEQKIVSKLVTQQTREQVLLIQLASRAYELEKGERPKTLVQLVPAYLKAIPQNPITGTNMAFP
jgi:hypothetical protein